MSKAVKMGVNMKQYIVAFAMALALPTAYGQPQTDWDQMMSASGVSEVLEQANVLIDQEIRNLEKAPLGFSTEDLQQMNQTFRERLGSERLKQDIMERLETELSSQEAQRLKSVLRSRELQKLNELQGQLADAQVRKEMRSYRVKIKENSPNLSRMELLGALDDTLQQSSMETELKVELRKQLLATVSHIKTNEVFSEDMLDAQLQDYRKEVEGEISENALHAYLYLLKRTPSSQVRDLLVTLDEPAFNEFMRICMEAMQASFLEARQQLQNELRIAGN